MQLAGCERRRRIAAALFLVDGADDPVCLFQSGTDLFRIFTIGNFNLLLALAHKPGVKRWRLAGGEMSVDRPIFFFLERLDLAFAFNDQAKGDGLYSSGGKTAADFIP